MKRSEDRILTTHVGSLVRPQALLDLAGYKLGPPKDPVHYGEVLRAAVAEVVRKQVRAGIDIVNDGEYGKSSWANYVVERVHPSVMWAKFEALAQGARLATNELWGRND
jgi:5-methyltetrahydropteroyltriglutamate--homocysteine methyltransferase